jgi:hypothetical protein
MFKQLLEKSLAHLHVKKYHSLVQKMCIIIIRNWVNDSKLNSDDGEKLSVGTNAAN